MIVSENPGERQHCRADNIGNMLCCELYSHIYNFAHRLNPKERTDENDQYCKEYPLSEGAERYITA